MTKKVKVKIFGVRAKEIARYISRKGDTYEKRRAMVHYAVDARITHHSIEGRDIVEIDMELP
jgi:hypothetical protein